MSVPEHLLHCKYMKRNQLLGLVGVAVVVIGALFLLIYKPLPASAPNADTSFLTGISYTEHTPYYDISTNYAATTTLAAEANTAAVSKMKQFISATIAEFKKNGNFANLTTEDITMMEGRKETLQITYLIASSQNTVSYIFTIYEDTLGAHGNVFFHTFTFDTGTGASLALGDVFLPGSSYLTTLSSLSRQKLQTALSESSMTSFIEDGTRPNADNFQNFFFDNGDFVLLFPPYQVAAYAAGPQTVRLSATELKDVLKPAYQ